MRNGPSAGPPMYEIPALAACPFTAGERNGQPVPVRITEFKVRFVLPEGR